MELLLSLEMFEVLYTLLLGLDQSSALFHRVVYVKYDIVEAYDPK